MGQVYYRDWTPGRQQDPTYNPVGSYLLVESWHSTPIRELPQQPNTYYDNRLSPAEFYLANVQEGYTVAIEPQYPHSDLAYRFAPAEPIRADVFAQMAQKWTGPTVAGTAPNRGIYSGFQNELGYE